MPLPMPQTNAKTEKPQDRYLKSALVAFSTSPSTNVEKASGIIKNVILCQVGPAKGHGLHLEQEFIEAGTAYANSNWSEVGLKSRFGHPNMSNDALGTECGRFRNFRTEGDKMLADLHLYDSANLSPTHPGMKDWLLSMASEDPAAIMCSIVFKADHYYQYNAAGEKTRVHEYDTKGRYIEPNGSEPVYVAMGELLATDIVDEGAATERLFSADINKDKFAVIATEFLDRNPELLSFITANPDKIPQFAQVYEAYRLKKKANQPTMNKFKLTWAAVLLALGFADKKEEDLPEISDEHMEQLNSELSAKAEALAAANDEIASLKTERDQLQGGITELQSKLAETERQSKANLDLAEQFRAASGAAFSETEKAVTDKIPAEPTAADAFASYGHNIEALKEIENL
jgi:hypothetical protein